MEKVTRSLCEKVFGKEEVVRERYEKTLKDLEELYAKRDFKGICIVSHPMILAVTIDGKVSHVVDQVDKKAEGNLKRLDQISAYLDVPRYTPEVAKIWLAEETKFNNSFLTPEEIKETYGKKLIGERDLVLLLIEDREARKESCERAIECFEKAEVA